jgi:hypothetical protein
VIAIEQHVALQAHLVNWHAIGEQPLEHLEDGAWCSAGM